MSNSSKSRSNNAGTPIRAGPFLLQVAGLPDGFTWKDLKDIIRPEATHSIWADISNHGPNDRRGAIKIGKYSEASRAYEKLAACEIGGRRVPVELWDISDVPVNCLTRSFMLNDDAYWAQIQRVQTIARQALLPAQVMTGHQSSRNAPHRVAQMPSSPSASQMAQLNAQMAQLQMQQRQMQQHQLHQQQLQQQQQQPSLRHPYAAGSYSQMTMQPTMYGMTQAGLPVNTMYGVDFTEYRGVFIQNLAFKATRTDLLQLFGQAGKVIRCDLKMIPDAKKNSGSATVGYASAREAQHAVDRFNGLDYFGRKMTVRFDKSSEVPLGSPNGFEQPSRANDQPVRATSQPSRANNNGPTIVRSPDQSGRGN